MEKQFMEKIISRLLPSSLSSCHFRNIPDVIDSSILISRNHQTSSKTNSPKHQFDINKPTNLSDFFKLAAARRVSVSDSKITKTTSSSNTGRWFTIEDAEIDNSETEPITSVSSSFCSSSSSSSCQGSSDIATSSSRCETRENGPSRCDTEMGFSLSEVSVCVKNSSGESIVSQQNTEKSCLKTSAKISRQRRVIKKLSHEDVMSEMPSSFSSTHIYYGGHCARKTTNGCRKTRRKGRWGKGTGIEKMTSRSSYVKVVEESYAVEKSSSDPYNDFRVSMVEMILEKEIYGENELEKLLECFLYLNSAYHHKIIIRVFLEVCTTLFPPPQ